MCVHMNTCVLLLLNIFNWMIFGCQSYEIVVQHHVFTDNYFHS